MPEVTSISLAGGAMATNNKVVAIAGTYNEKPLFVYTGNPLTAFTLFIFYRWISNAIFGSQLAELTDLQSYDTWSDLPSSKSDCPWLEACHCQSTGLNSSPDLQSQTLPETGSQKEQVLAPALAGLLVAGAAGLFSWRRKTNT